ncbi:PadR family transcriptional regulator [Clostridium sp. MSJ-8]|uniref:PadR family transcriptional regulator n=1 Tax=Clostridium sp. MSJ-8 TaxID=2841510 RepID=UPI001C0EF7ED|nr:helix-turn-helix transcriptional regulator [Clostridium sp. MSJ-8]MBU5486680.1 PadR family transcriptional regulator [Clostridium sp. MSJ-8]
MVFTDSSYYILLSLLKPRHGYGIMKYVEELTEGEFTIGPATLYTTIKKIQNSGYIELAGESEDRKKIYKLTQKGEEAILSEIKRRIRMAEQGKKVLKEVREVEGYE